MSKFDILIEGARYFDGTGAPSSIQNIAIQDGRIVLISDSEIAHSQVSRVIQAAGKWVMPGFIDSHTHYDAEMIASPSLSESVRHGVTTVLMGSCSLSMVCSDAEDASDIFTRVETIPRERVLPILQQHKSWNSPTEWVEYVNNLPLGPNVVSLLGHSDLRVSVMGLARATDLSVKPTNAEMQAMEDKLREALEVGFLGLSTMCLKWDKIDGDRAWSKSLPSTYARWHEISRLLKWVRKYNRVHQGAPNAATPLQVLQYLRECIGWLRRPLKTTLISQLDLKGSAYLNNLTRFTSFLTNLVRGDFRWQVLPAPFTVFADGIDVVLFEEFGAGEMALDLRDQIKRNRLLKDEQYRRHFRKFYAEKYSPRVWQRDFSDAMILDCPDTSIIGKDFAQVAEQRGIHVVDLFLDLVVEYGTKLRWFTTIGNHRETVLKRIVKNPRSLITFSDAGAHIRNMAFYNLPLRLLKLVQQSIDDDEAIMTMEQAIWRVTGDQADWFGIEAGKIRQGDRADVVVLDPNGFDQDLNQVTWAEMQNFNLQRLVNRNPGLVETVIINGKLAVDQGEVLPELGQQQGFGRFLPAR